MCFWVPFSPCCLIFLIRNTGLGVVVLDVDCKVWLCDFFDASLEGILCKFASFLVLYSARCLNESLERDHVEGWYLFLCNDLIRWLLRCCDLIYVFRV